MHISSWQSLVVHRARRGQGTRPQRKAVDGPSGSCLDHRSPIDAYGLTRFTCQTAALEIIKEGIFAGRDAASALGDGSGSPCSAMPWLVDVHSPNCYL